MQPHQRADLIRIAKQAMADHGLEADFSAAVEQQLATISALRRSDVLQVQDLTDLLWCSIDNDDSRDLDQLTHSEVLEHGAVRIRVAIADVDALVARDSPIDAHARTNTTSVYISACIFPMLPEKLSTDLTSLNDQQERLAVVTEMVLNADGSLAGSTVYRAWVRNHAKLAYDAVSAWLNVPKAAAAVAGMEEQLRTQDAMAQQLRARRKAQGSLEFETFQPRAVFQGETVVGIELQEHNRARQLIEELMIATNGCTAHYLASRGGVSLRRVVRSPDRWLRIVAVAKDYGEVLPPEPHSQALSAFLAKRHRIDPLRFPDLSLVIVKLMGAGEYVVESAHGTPIGHFGLAVRDYTHSTAPNRRFPDLITSRMIKAALANAKSPYSDKELADLALHCTRQEDASRKVERQMRKSEAALVLESRVGETFAGVVTGAAPKGVWVRIFSPPAEGKLGFGSQGLAVGDKVQVRLESVSVERGFIDFSRVSP
jgi:exoribonuclease II